MEQVYSKKSKIVSRVVTMVIGVLVGILLLVLSALMTEKTIYTIINVGLIVYGVLIIIGNIPGLVNGIGHIRQPEGVVDLILSILGIVMGGVLIFYHGVVFVWIVAVYMILFPVLRILLAPSGTRGEAFRRELLRMVMGVVLLVFLPGLVNIGATVVRWVLLIAGWTVIALAVLFGVVAIVRILTAKTTATTGTRIYVDTDGNGKIDTVLVDTTGDGKVDTAIHVDEKNDND